MKKDICELMRDHPHLKGAEVTIQGWVRNHRAQKAMGFIDVSDGTAFETVQVVYEGDSVGDDAESDIRSGASIEVSGTLVATPDMKQPFEIKARRIEVIGSSEEDYPIQPKRHSREFLRTHAHLRPRTNLFAAVFRIRSVMTYAIHRFFQERGYVHLASPIVTASDAEGAGDMFTVTTLDPGAVPKTEDGDVDYGKDFYGKAAKLTVSGQLQAEAFAQAFKKVYTFGPTFRAEKSNTTSHVSELWMMEPEVAFADLNAIVDLAEEMVKAVLGDVMRETPSELAFLDRFVEKGLLSKLQKTVETPFHRLTHEEAVDRLLERKEPYTIAPAHDADLATEHEKALTEILGGPVFVTDWPKAIKAFYMRVNDDGRTVAAVDLLMPGAGEVIGGSQREERLDVLLERMKEMGVGERELKWYLDLRRYGTTPHAGYGLGFDRLLMYVCGIANIRDVIPFPRYLRHCEF